MSLVLDQSIHPACQSQNQAKDKQKGLINKFREMFLLSLFSWFLPILGASLNDCIDRSISIMRCNFFRSEASRLEERGESENLFLRRSSWSA